MLSFLNFDDIIKVGKINIRLRNSVKEYFSQIRKNWEQILMYIEKKYNLNIPEINEYNNLDDILFKKNYFAIKDHMENVLQFKSDFKPIFYGLFNKVTWAWVNDNSYYTQNLCQNSTLGETRILKEVFWIDCKLNLHNIPMGNYSLKIRHTFNSLTEETLKLEVFVENNEIYSTLYPTKAFLEENEKINRTFEDNEKKEIILYDSYLCNINENQFKIISVTLK